MQPPEHYSDLNLIDYLNGRVSPADMVKMDEHLDVCGDCRTRLNMCQAMHNLMSDKIPSDPPGEWVREGLSMFDPKLFSGNPEYVFAGLTADSLMTADSELRSASIHERQVSFESSAYVVSVLVETSGFTLKGVVGQVSRKAAGPNADELKGTQTELHLQDKVYRAELTEFGEFLFRVNEHMDGNPIELRFRMKEEPCLVLLIPC